MAVRKRVSAQTKLKLEGAQYGADLSGMDFSDRFLGAGDTLSHSFLNGVSLHSCTFVGTKIDQTELAEAEILDCNFKDIDLNGTSFISATISNTTFESCDFTDGEWRKSKFTNVRFVRCRFNYTTLNLCVFENCKFVGEGSKGLSNKSVSYNVFARTKFEFKIEDDNILAINFGLPAARSRKGAMVVAQPISLEQVCLLSSLGRPRATEIVDAIENEFGHNKQQRLKPLRLEFVSNILYALSEIRYISATSLLYLETLFVRLARVARVEVEALAAMSVVLSIRNIILRIADEGMAYSQSVSGDCDRLTIRYTATYSRTNADELAALLSDLTGRGDGTFSIRKFASGSTLIDLVTTNAASLGAALVAVNFALRQASITLVRARSLKTSAKKLLSNSAKPRRPKRKVSKLPALLSVGQYPKELTNLRRAVRSHGYSVVVLDDEATVDVRYRLSK